MPNTLTTSYSSAGITVSGTATAPTQFLPIILRRDLIAGTVDSGGNITSSNDSLGNAIEAGEYLVIGVWLKADGSLNGECTVKKVTAPP